MVAGILAGSASFASKLAFSLSWSSVAKSSKVEAVDEGGESKGYKIPTSMLQQFVGQSLVPSLCLKKIFSDKNSDGSGSLIPAEVTVVR